MRVPFRLWSNRGSEFRIKILTRQAANLQEEFYTCPGVFSLPWCVRRKPINEHQEDHHSGDRAVRFRGRRSRTDGREIRFLRPRALSRKRPEAAAVSSL